MDFVPPVIIEIIASIRDFQAKKDQVIGGMEEIQTVGDSTSAKLSYLGGKIVDYGLLAGAAVGAAAVKLAYDYNEALDSMRTQTDLTSKQVDQLSPQILKVSTATATSSTQIATAYTQVIKAGVPLSQVQYDVAASAMFAKAQQASLTDTLTAALNIQKLHITGTKSVSQTMDIFTDAIQHSRLAGQDIDNAMSGKFVNTLQAYGISVKEGTVLLAGFANEGRTGVKATQVLQTGIASLEKPMVSSTGKLTTTGKALAQLGINQTTLASEIKKPGGILNVLQYLNTAFQDNATSAQKAQGITSWLNQIVGSQAGGAFASLIQQLPQLQQMLTQMNTTGSNKSAFQTWLSTPAGALAQFRTSLENALIPLGNFLLPIISKAFSGAAKVFSNKDFMTAFSGIGAAILAGMAGFKLASVGVSIAEAFGATIAAGTATLIGSAIATAIVAGLAIFGIGGSHTSQSDWNSMHYEEQQNKAGFTWDVFATTVNTFTGAINKLIGPGPLKIPNVPIIHGKLPGYTTTPNGRADISVPPTSGKVSVKVH